VKTVAFHLQKGGVGKSTLTVSVAWELATMGHVTVVIDCDPQGNSSSWLLEGQVPEPEHELADVLLGRVPPEAAAVQVDGNLYCIPTFGLTSALRNYAKSGLASEPYVIADMVERLPFDYAVLDLGPGLGTIEQAALLATDEVVLTMTPEYFSLDGLETWAEAVRAIEKGMRAKVHYDKLVVNGINESVKQMRAVRDDARKAARHVYEILVEPAFRKAQAQHIPAQCLTEGRLKAKNRETLLRLAKDLQNGTTGR
jgi:chromosome partitioning protein